MVIAETTLIIWADGHSGCGLGHLGRSLRYAHIHDGPVVCVGCFDSTVPEAWFSGVSKVELEEGYSADHLIAVIDSLTDSNTVVLIDHYRCDASLSRQLRCLAPVIVTEDWPHRHLYSDVLLVPVPVSGEHKRTYQTLVNPDCLLAFGLEWRVASEVIKSPKLTTGMPHLLVHLGGVVPSVSYQLLNEISGTVRAESVKVILGHERKMDTERELSRLYRQLGSHVEFIAPVADYQDILQWADLVIGAAGVSAWDRLYFGVPQILIKVAENQAYNFRVFRENNWATCTKMGELKRVLNQPLPCVRAPESRLSPRRWLLLLEGLLTPVRLRRWTEEDSGVVFDMQQQSHVRAFARDPNVPSIEEHQSFFNRALQEGSDNYIVEVEGQAAGVVRLSLKNEVSIYFDQDHVGKGYGRMALQWLKIMHWDVCMLAYVKDTNTASKRLFESMEYLPKAVTDSGIWYKWESYEGRN